MLSCLYATGGVHLEDRAPCVAKAAPNSRGFAAKCLGTAGSHIIFSGRMLGPSLIASGSRSMSSSKLIA